MHAPAVGRRGFQFQPRSEASHFVMSDFAHSNDHAMMLQGRDKSRIYPVNPGQVLQGGGSTRNNTVYGDSRAAGVASYGKGGLCAQTQKNDVIAVTMGAETRLLSPDGYPGRNIFSEICPSEGNTDPTHAQHKNKGSDPFLLDWPDLGPLEDLETDLRKIGSTFEIGSYYFDDPMWPSICSPDAQLVPSSHFDNDPISSTVANKPILQSTDPVPDSTDQLNLANPTNAQQPSRNKGRETPLDCSPEEIERFPPLSDADIFFCPFDDMLVPTSSTTVCNDVVISSSGGSTSGPDELVSSYVARSSPKKKAHATAPDMMLDEMAENPLEMYFPPLTMYELHQVPMSGTAPTLMHHQLLPGGFAGESAPQNSSGLQLGPQAARTSGGGLRDNPHSPSITKATPVKNHGFQKLQEGMNQLDVGTKTCIRDALYRLANNVEQRHGVDPTVGSSGAANRFKTPSVWTETQGCPMDRSVAQLLLQKPLYQTTDRQANRVA